VTVAAPDRPNMKKLRNHLVGVDQGDMILFSDFEHDGRMWTGTGHRQSRARVEFSESYRSPPIVHVTTSMWDISSRTNARVDLATEDIGTEGFTIVFKTWDDTRIARIRVAWLSIGELHYADDWDIS